MGKKKSKKGGGGAQKSKSKPKLKRLQGQKGRNSAAESVVSSAVGNPFEMRVNKRKHDNLGRRGRNELGVPGISRGKAIDKRNKTLLQEYKVRNKSSVLLDNRIGEKRKGMPEEEKIIRRSAAEKARQFKQKSIFNLQESDEFLTHRGQPLLDVDRYEDPRDASDSEDERLNADFVSDANFGGFMRIKKAEEEDVNEEDLDDDGQPKSHKQIIQELILASKQKKYEKAKEADENYELVCKLDEDFKNPDIRDLLFGVSKDKSKPIHNEPATTEREAYDTLVKELQFETKTGRAADRLKTDEEVADEEKQKLEQLEKDRLRRMQMTDADGVLKHRSADDLDDGYYMGDVKNQGSENLSEEDSDAEDSSSEDEKSEDNESSDGYVDLESDEEPELKSTTSAKTKLKLGDAKLKVEEVEKTKIENEDFPDIPFVLGIPEKFPLFESMLKKFKAYYKSSSPELNATRLNVILSRMIKYNTAADRTKLSQLFNYIVRYTLETAEAIKRLNSVVTSICEVVLPHLHTLLILNPTGCVEAVEKGEIFDDFYPVNNLPLCKILYFDLCSSLFCCTDFHHHVLSPIKVKLSDILSLFKISHMKCVMKILYIVKIMYTLCKESNRYSPEVLNAVGSILQCFAGKSVQGNKYILPSYRQAKELLFIPEEENVKTCAPKTKIWKLLDDNNNVSEHSSEEKLGVLGITLGIAKKFIEIYEKHPSSKEAFVPIRKVLCELQVRKTWPQKIVEKIDETVQAIDKIKEKKDALAVTVSDKPKPLRLYEPLIEEDFDGMRKKKVPKGKQETGRLAHKVKQEMKSAVREIRKDTAFLATQQLREQLEKDSERKRKVKDIMGSLANQEGEYQKCKRGKK